MNTGVDPTKAFSIVTPVEDGCTFDLNFAMDSQDDCFGEGSVRIGRVSPFDSKEDPKTANNRKRKVDDEGFVKPQTPDIPKTSLKYGFPSHRNQEVSEEHAGGGAEGGAGEEDPAGSLSGHGAAPATSSRDAADGSKEGGRSEEEGVATGENSSANVAPKQFDNVSDLFTDLRRKNKMLMLQFAKSFRKSEEFEAFCMAKVDQISNEALVVEQRVTQQKEMLRRRLEMLGHRLEQTDKEK